MRRYLLFLCLLTLLACSPLRMYQQLPEVKSWEGDISQLEHLDSIETHPENAILFAGSSSIRLWETLSQDMDPYPVIQRGYGGAKLSDFAVYAERIIYPHPCSAIVLFIANDITGNEADKSPEEVARLFSNVLKTIRRKYTDTPVFWIAVTPTPLRWNAWPQITEANKMIEHLCLQHKNTYFIRTDTTFLNDAQRPRGELFLPDSLHLNAQGYSLWADIIRKELTAVLGY
jgi:hypothetical protein